MRAMRLRDKKPWLKHLGKLKHLRKANASSA